MQLYKWYKGTELPTEECRHDNYLIIFNINGTTSKCIGRFFYSHEEHGWGPEPFWRGVFPRIVWISKENVIAYMPIEFPKEIK